MRALTPELMAHLTAGRESNAVDLWTVILPTGTTLRWTGGDVPLTWAGHTYGLGPLLDRGSVSWSLGLDPDELEVRITPRDTDVVGSVSLRAALTRGDFDGASVRLARGYGTAPGVLIGVIDHYFTGHVGDIESDGATFTCEVRSPLALLDRPFPAGIVQPACANRLFDATCGLNPTTWRVTASVTGGIAAARNQFAASALTQAAGYFRGGRLQFTGGPNTGRSLAIRDHAAGGVLTFAQPWPDAVAVGNAFEAWPGCDKTRATCIAKFSNLARFRGAPFVPAPETAT